MRMWTCLYVFKCSGVGNLPGCKIWEDTTMSLNKLSCVSLVGHVNGSNYNFHDENFHFLTVRNPENCPVVCVCVCVCVRACMRCVCMCQVCLEGSMHSMCVFVAR